MIALKALAAYIATAPMVQNVAPSSAAWAQLDFGIGLKSGVIVMILAGALAAVVRDRHKSEAALFGTFLTAVITTAAFVHFAVRPLFDDVASQAIAGCFLAYNAQLWAGKATKATMKKIAQKYGSQVDE